jgi:hypothetical protein
MILKSETYHFHRLDLTRQAGFIVTIYDEQGLRLASTPPLPTPSWCVGIERAFAATGGGSRARGEGGRRSGQSCAL